MDRDRRGRKRQEDQGRGLRPLHPVLPERWASRALRVAMSRDDWARFDAIVDSVNAPTLARAQGVAISCLLETATHSAPTPGPLDWMDWERQKTLRLLRSAV